MPVGRSGFREAPLDDRQQQIAFLRILGESSGRVGLLPRLAGSRHPTHLHGSSEDPCPIIDLTSERVRGNASSDENLDSEPEPCADPSAFPHVPSKDSFKGPKACSFLSPGQTFEGYQRYSSNPRRSRNPSDDWTVSLCIHEYNAEKGYASGIMKAFNLPHRTSPVQTFWEADVIDNQNHTFFTRNKWGADRETDMGHWTRFGGFTSTLRAQALAHDGRCAALPAAPCIFMRLKEQFFVDELADTGLTIAGFYYISLDRQTGVMSGYYWDAASSPFQLLLLKPVSSAQGSRGVSFGSYALH